MRNLVIPLVAIIATVAPASVACATGFNVPDHATSADRLAKISVADGIARHEAEAIAVHFFYYFQGMGCGAVTSMKCTSSDCIVYNKVGFAGETGDPIRVRRSDGAIFWGEKQCLDNPLAMLTTDVNSTPCAFYPPRESPQPPDSAVSPAHSAVTALAGNSKRRAAGRAGYRDR